MARRVTARMSLDDLLEGYSSIEEAFQAESDAYYAAKAEGRWAEARDHATRAQDLNYYWVQERAAEADFLDGHPQRGMLQGSRRRVASDGPVASAAYTRGYEVGLSMPDSPTAQEVYLSVYVVIEDADFWRGFSDAVMDTSTTRRQSRRRTASDYWADETAGMDPYDDRHFDDGAEDGPQSEDDDDWDSGVSVVEQARSRGREGRRRIAVQYDEYGYPVDCLYEGDEFGPCRGEPQLFPAPSGTGTMIGYCPKHYDVAMQRDQEIRERYPYNAPSDFDPDYAGERWDDDY